MRQTLREALGIGHWALPACAETPGVTAGAPQRMARLPTLPHCRIATLANCFKVSAPTTRHSQYGAYAETYPPVLSSSLCIFHPTAAGPGPAWQGYS